MFEVIDFPGGEGLLVSCCAVISFDLPRASRLTPDPGRTAFRACKPPLNRLTSRVSFSEYLNLDFKKDNEVNNSEKCIHRQLIDAFCYSAYGADADRLSWLAFGAKEEWEDRNV